MEFSSYRNGCVMNYQNTTLISRNIQSMALNFASYDGNVEKSMALQGYNSDVAKLCSNSYQKSESRTAAIKAQILETTQEQEVCHHVVSFLLSSF